MALLPRWARPLLTRRMAICLVTGFASGMPLYLLLNLLPAWLRSEGVSLTAIGLFALVQFPYTWKFVWAPLLDRFVPPLGRRRGWIALTQVALLVLIATLGYFSPQTERTAIVWLTALLAFLSATADIAFDAYRRELLSEEELGLGNALHVNAYRLAGLVPGALALILAETLPWKTVFAVTALFMVPGILLALLAPEPAVSRLPKSLREAAIEPWREFLSRAGVGQAFLVLAFILFYKLGDSLATSLATPFYLDMGYGKADIGWVAKQAGLWPAILGGVVGGVWMVRLGIARALWLFGGVQLVSILGFVWLAALGPQPVIDGWALVRLAAVIGFEAFGVGLGTAAFVAFIAQATHPAYTATQFALLTSLAAVPRTVLNSAAGWLVEQLGWVDFYWLCVVVALPGMVLLYWVAPWRSPPVAQRAASAL